MYYDLSLLPPITRYICRETLVQDVQCICSQNVWSADELYLLKNLGLQSPFYSCFIKFFDFQKTNKKKPPKTKINKWKKKKKYIFNRFFANNFSIVFVKQEVTSLCKDLYHFTRTKKIQTTVICIISIYNK